MKRAKRLYVLLGVLAVVCAAAALVIRHEEKQEAIRNSGEVVLAVDVDAVDALSWTYEDTALSFHREDSAWSYDGDSAFPVDGEKISSMLERFRAFSAVFAIEEVEDFGQYGLDDPLCTISLSAGEDSYTITLGDYSTMDEQRYVSIGDGNVYLVADDPLEDFDAPLSEVILNDETPDDFGDVSAISFDGEESYRVVYQAYTEDSPYTYCAEDVYFREKGSDLLPLDTSLVESYLSTLSSLPLTDYVTYTAGEEDLAQWGLDDPELTVTVTYTPEDGDKEETFTLSVSRDPEELAAAEAGEEETEVAAYARVGDSPIVYHLTAGSCSALMAAGYDDLRHAAVFTGDFDQVTAMAITMDGRTYTLTAQEDGDGTQFLYDGEEADMSDFRAALESLGADSFTDEEPTQAREIAITLTLDSEAHPQVEIALYRYDGALCLAEVDGEPVSLVPRADVVTLMEAVNAVVL